MTTSVAEGMCVTERDYTAHWASWPEEDSGNENEAIQQALAASPYVPARQDSVLDFIYRIQQRTNRRQIEAELAQELAVFGIEYFLIADLCGDHTGQLLSGQVHPQAMQLYEEKNYGAIDPLVREAEKSGAPIIWSSFLACHSLPARQKKIYAELSAYGLCDGMYMTLSAPNHKAALAACSGKAPRFNARARTSVQAMLVFTYNRLMQLDQIERHPAPKITRREADCLTWVARGKTDWEIGEILHISENTVHWYIERAKRKLGVSTRIQAVVGAIHDGAIRI